MAWICGVQTESMAPCELLDEDHPSLPTDSPHDDSACTLGDIDDHHMVINTYIPGVHWADDAKLCH